MEDDCGFAGVSEVKSNGVVRRIDLGKDLGLIGQRASRTSAGFLGRHGLISRRNRLIVGMALTVGREIGDDAGEWNCGSVR